MGLETKNIVIVGAGVIGLACAVRLTNAGHKVTLIDKDEPGKGTSFGNAGHIATEQIHPLASPQTIASLPRYLLDPRSPIKLPLSYLPKVSPWLMRFAYASRPSQYRHGTAALKSLQETALPDLRELLSIAKSPDLLHQSGNLVVLEKS
ncbi:MAG: NAD(P)/FAD-dependent oxidoreductase, partial [Kordiimonas sp.]